MIKIEKLVEESKRGKKEAYSELITSIESDLYKIAKSRLKNDEDIKDAMQEAIMNAYLNIHKLKNNKKFKSWIVKILINECNKIYGNQKRKLEVTEKISSSHTFVDHMDDKLEFDNIVKHLTEKERKIFSLYYEDGLTIKEIAEKLHINENTIKTSLSRGKLKIKKAYKPATIFMFILCLIIATSVIAVSIISYIKSLFEVNSVGIENDGVLTAIEHLDWFQEANMDYIDLGDGNKIKVEYLLMDEMNLYLVFDFTSEKDISKFSDISFPDLKILNENGDVICDEQDLFAEHYSKKTSFKLIENNKNSIKALAYMYTDSFPISKTLDISFSKIMLSKKSILSKNNYLNIPTNANFKINLSEKFINRDYITYKSNNDRIEKAIITETGFYVLFSGNSISKLNKARLIDENGIFYDCYFNSLTDYNFDTVDNIKYIIIANFNNKQNEKLKLIIDDTEYELLKE